MKNKKTPTYQEQNMKLENVYVEISSSEVARELLKVLLEAGEVVSLPTLGRLKRGVVDYYWTCVCRNDGVWEGATTVPLSKVKVSVETLKEQLKLSDNNPTTPINAVDSEVEPKGYREFETGSRRDSDEGKPRVADLKAYTRLRFGFHMLIGSERYGEGNFELGQPDDSTLKSVHRHLAQFELGDDSEDHLSAIIFGVQMLMLNQQRGDVPVNKYYEQYKLNKL